jgi:hypothetical protein
VELVMPGLGDSFCVHVTPAGRGCTKREVLGLEYCLRHMPDDLLDEAEEVTGWKRCRNGYGQPGACHSAAVTGTVPPACKNHGANQGSNTYKAAAERVVEGRMADRLVLILAEHGEAFLHPDPIGNPLEELLDLAAEVKAFKEALRHVAAYLFSKDRMRSAHDKVGEQLRAEIILYERAQERLGHLLVQIAKLGIEAKLASIEIRQRETIERALTIAIQRAGGDLAMQDQARTELIRELAKAG